MDIREQLIQMLLDLRPCGCKECREDAKQDAAAVLALLEANGYVKMAKDQTLPRFHISPRLKGDRYDENGYRTAQEDMADWRKVEPLEVKP
jgi:hypothetical protein